MRDHRSSLAVAAALSLPLFLSPGNASAASLAPSTVIPSVMLVEPFLGTSALLGEDLMGQRHPLSLPAGSLLLTVVSVEAASERVAVVVGNAADGSKFGFRVSRQVVEDAGLAAGQSVDAVATASGHILVASGRTIGLVLNAESADLLYQRELQR